MSQFNVRRVSPVWPALALATLVAACAQTTPPPAQPAASPEPVSAPSTAGAPAPVTAANPPDPAGAEAKPDSEPAESEPEPAEPVNCASGTQFGPLALTEDEATTRHGSGTSTLADLSSSKQRPVEVCGPEGETNLLMQLTCADGSHPLANTLDAMRARAGSVGAGGRCGKIVDLYQVTCPEKTYDVYMDMYFCGPGEVFMP